MLFVNWYYIFVLWFYYYADDFLCKKSCVVNNYNYIFVRYKITECYN